ncbi:MAG: hypothetical protein PUD22_09660 [Erysipelotrichaceae bacterium]|nr:hypothetical protein [Erysipelotrichaceae bacterium]
MNDEKIVKSMIEFIEKEERDLQAATLLTKGKASGSDIPSKILAKLDKEIENED